jgi:hypothetical protein
MTFSPIYYRTLVLTVDPREITCDRYVSFAGTKRLIPAGVETIDWLQLSRADLHQSSGVEALIARRTTGFTLPTEGRAQRRGSISEQGVVFRPRSLKTCKAPHVAPPFGRTPE